MEESKEIIWSFHAKEDLKTIYEYYAQFSLTIANRIVDRIYDKVSILQAPNAEQIGQFDEFNSDFRRLISGNYKIFYKVFDSEILIVRIFDSRQNPSKVNSE